MKQPDRIAKEDRPKLDREALLRNLRFGIWSNFLTAVGSYVLFVHLLPVFFTGSGALTGKSEMGEINQELARVFAEAAPWVAGAFIALSVFSAIGYVFVRMSQVGVDKEDSGVDGTVK
jgi:hypothetical protein